MFGKGHCYYKWQESMVVSKLEKTSIVKKFKNLKQMTFDRTLFACSACMWNSRFLDMSQDSVTVSWLYWEIEGLSRTKSWFGKWSSKFPWVHHKVRFVFVDPKDTTTKFHLNSEMVTIEKVCGGKSSVILCQKCFACVLKQKRSPSVIAAGVEFGLLYCIAEFIAMSA